MFLSVGISILLDSYGDICTANLTYAKELLRYFVRNCCAILGTKFCVYNLHGLVHLHEDVEYNQCSLNDISCFPFDSFLQKVKGSVRNCHSPLVQICKRQQEKFTFTLKQTKHYTKVKPYSLKDRFFFMVKMFCLLRKR